MGDLTKNLSRHEFACKCGCGLDTADYDLVLALQGLVDHFESLFLKKVALKITGPNRCREHNETVQKKYNSGYVPYSSKSMHMICAVDFKLFIKSTKEQILPDSVATYLESKYPDEFGIGRYRNRTHLDARTVKKRWGK